MAAIAHFIEVGVQRPCRDFVQERLPDMGAVSLDQDDVVLGTAISRAKMTDQLKASSAAPDDDDLGLP
jgi:hypothetical protein